MKKKSKYLALTIALLVSALVHPARADIVFNNFDAGGAFSRFEWSGGAIYDPVTPAAARVAVEFKVGGANYSLSSITLPISYQGFYTSYLRIRVTTDGGGFPGTTLEVLSDGQNIWPPYQPTVATTLPSLSHPVLVAGHKYWVVAELNNIPPGGMSFFWHTSSCALDIPQAQDQASGGGLPMDPWDYAFGSFKNALRVEGTPLTPVEPDPEVGHWPNDPTQSVRISVKISNQFNQVLASDGNGGAIIAWEDTRAGNSDIYVQRVNAVGRVLWTCDGLALTTSTAPQSSPAIIADGSGGAIVTWADRRNGASYKTYAQRIDASGIFQWTTEGVALCNGSGDQVNPVLVSDGAGGAIVAWTDWRVSAADIYAQRIGANGALVWLAAGVAVATAADVQSVPDLVGDSAGGAIIAWRDFRNAIDLNIYAQHLNAVGTVLWTANGIAITAALNDQTEVHMVPDDLGGAIVVWLDGRNGLNTTDIYAQRVNGAGSLRWGSNGIPVCTAAGNQANVRLMSDGKGGAITAWQDPRDGSWDVYVEHLRSAGTTPYVDGIWVAAASQDELNPALITDGAGGAVVVWQDWRTSSYDLCAARFDATETVSWLFFNPVSNYIGDQQLPQMVTDGRGGAIVVWQTLLSGTTDLFANRLDHFGYLGNPEPEPLIVIDVPADQGGKVQVTWAQSYLEDQFSGVVGGYRVWRSVPSQAPGLGSLSNQVFTTDPEVAVRTGEPLLTQLSGQTQAWEFLGTVTANGSATYQFLASTAQDSVPGLSPRTAFMIQARPSSGTIPYFFSTSISGYSVDNLFPGPPTGFSAIYGPGAVDLHWHANPEPDIGSYRIYRGTTADFVPGPASFFLSVPDTDYVGAADRSYVYKLTAVDIHGNESSWVMVAPWSTGVENQLPARFLMSGPTPNPARDMATIRWSLPQRGVVSLQLYDIEGRRVKVLEAGTAEAGDHVLPIPLRDDSGRTLASGLYFLRLDWNGTSRTQRIAVVR